MQWAWPCSKQVPLQGVDDAENQLNRWQLHATTSMCPFDSWPYGCSSMSFPAHVSRHHQLSRLTDPKILLLNIELELKSEKENAEVNSAQLCHCMIGHMDLQPTHLSCAPQTPRFCCSTLSWSSSQRRRMQRCGWMTLLSTSPSWMLSGTSSTPSWQSALTAGRKSC